MSNENVWKAICVDGSGKRFEPLDPAWAYSEQISPGAIGRPITQGLLQLPGNRSPILPGPLIFN